MYGSALGGGRARRQRRDQRRNESAWRRHLKSIEYSGSGDDYASGRPSTQFALAEFNDKTYTRLVDLNAPASRMHSIRTQAEDPPRVAAISPIIGEQPQNQVIAAGSPQAATLQDELMMTLPYSFLKSAGAAKDTMVKSQSMGGKKYTVLSFTGPNKALVQGFLNSDNLLERLDTKINNNVLGDIPSRLRSPITRISPA